MCVDSVHGRVIKTSEVCYPDRASPVYGCCALKLIHQRSDSMQWWVMTCLEALCIDIRSGTMTGRIYLLQDDGTLQSLTEKPYQLLAGDHFEKRAVNPGLVSESFV